MTRKRSFDTYHNSNIFKECPYCGNCDMCGTENCAFSTDRQRAATLWKIEEAMEKGFCCNCQHEFKNGEIQHSFSQNTTQSAKSAKWKYCDKCSIKIKECYKEVREITDELKKFLNDPEIDNWLSETGQGEYIPQNWMEELKNCPAGEGKKDVRKKITEFEKVKEKLKEAILSSYYHGQCYEDLKVLEKNLKIIDSKRTMLLEELWKISCSPQDDTREKVRRRKVMANNANKGSYFNDLRTLPWYEDTLLDKNKLIKFREDRHITEDEYQVLLEIAEERRPEVEERKRGNEKEREIMTRRIKIDIQRKKDKNEIIKITSWITNILSEEEINDIKKHNESVENENQSGQLGDGKNGDNGNKLIIFSVISLLIIGTIGITYLVKKTRKNKIVAK